MKKKKKNAKARSGPTKVQLNLRDPKIKINFWYCSFQINIIIKGHCYQKRLLARPTSMFPSP